MRLAAPVPLTGRYAVQGQQMAAGLRLWSRRSGADLLLEDDQSDPQRAVKLFRAFLSPTEGIPSEASGWGPDIVLGPYGSDCVRAVATSLPDALVWNHGAAADDIQRLRNVISLPSPSSEYLVALARAVAHVRPGASVVVVTAIGRFADYAWNGLTAEAAAVNLTIAGHFTLGESTFSPANNFPRTGEGRVGAFDAVLAIGPLDKEISLFRQLRKSQPDLILGGISPGLSSFPQALGSYPEGFLAPVQWHPDLGQSPQLGPSSSEVVTDACSLGLGPLDYVAAQGYAAALIASYCVQRNATDPAKAARELHTSTFFGEFALEPNTGEQRGHRMAVIQWRGGRQELIAES